MIRLAILVAGLLAAAPQPAVAQDETALRYYAAQGRRDRAEAEIRRLQATHPGWQVPADLWTAKPGGPEEAPLWRLFAAERLDELSAAIAERQRREPDWRPSADLATKLARKRLRQAVLAATADGRWQDAGRVAAGIDPGTTDLELAWAVAEARARTGAPAEAAALYRALIVADLPPESRRTTLLKSLAVLPIRLVDDLVEAARAGTAPLDLEPVRGDIVRARVSAVIREEETRDLTAAESVLFRDEALRSGSGPDLALVAWYEVARRNPVDALGWFRRALAAGGDPVVAHGLAQTLVRLGQREKALDEAQAWSDRLAHNAILFIDLVADDLMTMPPVSIAAARLDQMARLTLRTASGEGAQALGWSAWNACDAAAALPWFERAVAWHPREGAVLGLGLALQRLGRRKEAAELANRYDGLFPKAVGLVMRQAGTQPDRCSQKGREPAVARDVRPAVPLPVPATGTSFAKGEFPLAVAAESPLRFETGPAGRRLVTQTAPATAPTVARRVGGVGPMPYEGAGIVLQPGWAGQTTAAAITADQAPPVPGTRWETLRLNEKVGARARRSREADGSRFVPGPVSRPEPTKSPFQ
jgi:tetratricopeptide (TPR) repeat protein